MHSFQVTILEKFIYIENFPVTLKIQMYAIRVKSVHPRKKQCTETFIFTCKSYHIEACIDVFSNFSIIAH